MARDKARDDLLFNCSQEHEINYVASQYPGNEAKVRRFLTAACASGRIKNMTHAEVYALIKRVLGLSND